MRFSSDEKPVSPRSPDGAEKGFSEMKQMTQDAPLGASQPTPFDDGNLYDLFFNDFDYGLDFYLGLARETEGPILDLCCGTGRFLLPATASGHAVDGVDLFPGMLERLRAKSSAEGFSPNLFEADMKSFATGREYGLVVIAFNAFVHNLTAEDQISTLVNIRNHLKAGGMLAFDTFFPGAHILGAPDGERVLELEIPNPETGLPVRIYDTRNFDRVAQIQRSKMDMEFLDANGEVADVRESYTTIRYLYRQEMELLLRHAGFSRWELFGNFERKPLTDETDAMIVCAWK